MIDALKPAFVKAIKEFYKANHAWPEKILVFRDGVGDSQLSIVARYRKARLYLFSVCQNDCLFRYEAEQFRDTFRHISTDYAPSFGFIVVSKRINTRIFAMGGKAPDNPAPGTVLDHTVTKRDWFDFFLVSQHVGQVNNPYVYFTKHDFKANCLQLTLIRAQSRPLTTLLSTTTLG